MRKCLTLAVVVCALCAGTTLLLPAPFASAAGLSPAVADCNAHLRLTRHYSPAQLRGALSTMPADIKEYTNCYDVIQRALLAELGSVHDNGSAGAGGSGGSFLPTPVIVVIVLLALAAAVFGAVAIRRRGSTPS
jgi:hypothetical protein